MFWHLKISIAYSLLMYLLKSTQTKTLNYDITENIWDNWISVQFSDEIPNTIKAVTVCTF